mgnify:CR=1 FL=1
MKYFIIGDEPKLIELKPLFIKLYDAFLINPDKARALLQLDKDRELVIEVKDADGNTRRNKIKRVI